MIRKKIPQKFYSISKIVAALFMSLAFLFVSPYISLQLGNIFFFKVPFLYNATFANFFYTYAAYPPLTNAVPYAHHQLSRVLFVEGYLEQAKDEANEELTLYPDHTQTYYLLGLTYGYLQEEKLAIDAFSSFIEYHPETWAGRNDKAWLQFRIGDIKGAKETIEPVVYSEANNPWVQNTYCAILINLNKFDEAKEACDRAKATIDIMPYEIWGKAYPGNDPRIYSTGLEATRNSILKNMEIINEHTQNSSKK